MALNIQHCVVDWRLCARLFYSRPMSSHTQQTYAQLRIALDEPELKAAWFVHHIFQASIKGRTEFE